MEEDICPLPQEGPCGLFLVGAQRAPRDHRGVCFCVGCFCDGTIHHVRGEDT